MHDPVIGRLEEYLDGNGPFPEVEKHLKECSECRSELTAMRSQANLLRQAFRVDLEPNAGFYARVINRIETQAKPSVWSLFGESMFAKRLVYASASFLLLAGAVFFSATETDQPLASNDPEVILAGEERYTPVTMDSQRDRDVVLVNLATYTSTSQDYQ